MSKSKREQTKGTSMPVVKAQQINVRVALRRSVRQDKIPNCGKGTTKTTSEGSSPDGDQLTNMQEVSLLAMGKGKRLIIPTLAVPEQTPRHRQHGGKNMAGKTKDRDVRPSQRGHARQGRSLLIWMSPLHLHSGQALTASLAELEQMAWIWLLQHMARCVELQQQLCRILLQSALSLHLMG